MLTDEKTVELRQIPTKTVPSADVRHLHGKKEALLNAWRPAGSSSLTERWLAAGTQATVKKPRHTDLLRAAKALADD